eukprot:s1171_g26.t1
MFHRYRFILQAAASLLSFHVVFLMSTSSSSSSLSSSSLSTDDELDEPPERPLELANDPLDAVNVSLALRETSRRMVEQQRKLSEVLEQHSVKLRLKCEGSSACQAWQKVIEDTQKDLVAAKCKPRADELAVVAFEPAAFSNGSMVKIKRKWWKDLKPPLLARCRDISCHWRVCHYDLMGFYTLMLPVTGHVQGKVPANALEELDFQLEPDTSVSVFQAPALPDHLLHQLRQIPNWSDGGHGILKQRKSDTSFEVSFPNGLVLPIPNANLHPPASAKPPAPAAERMERLEPQRFLGFSYLDFVRDTEERKGIVAGLCPENPRNLIVQLPSYGTKISIPATDLISEEAYFSQKLTACTERVTSLQEGYQKIQAEVLEEERKLKVLREEQNKLVKLNDEAKRAKCEAEKNACSLNLVKLVRFKSNDRPKAWREISSYVVLEWFVMMESNEAEKAVQCRRLQDFIPVARQVIGEETNQDQIFNSKEPNACAFRMSRSVANKILKFESVTSVTSETVDSLTLMRASLSASLTTMSFLLAPEVKEYFNGPIGLLKPKNVHPPASLASILRSYQVAGFRWLVNNAQNHLGCLLADDMGLGKTLQTICLMMYLKQENLLKAQSQWLVVVPSGLIETWRRELEHWAKDTLKLHLYYGNRRQLPPAAAEGEPAAKKRRKSKQPENQPNQPNHPNNVVPEVSAVDVVLTSYGVLSRDAEKLKKIRIGGMILDEAQQIKNPNTDQSKAVKRVAQVAEIRVALTGTPVENTLTDLYSIFEFILPGYLAEYASDFDRTFSNPLKGAARKGMDATSKERKDLLNRIKEPFMLRRLKTDPRIAADLPAKIEQTHECELSHKQRKLYQLVQEKQLAACSTGSQGPLQMLHAMREVCNHPATLDERRRPEAYDYEKHPPKSTDVEISGKCAKLHELLDTILAAGEKVLVFATRLSAIDVLMQQIQKRKDKPKAMKIIGDVKPQEREAQRLRATLPRTTWTFSIGV